jgi:hypothetical protein
MVYQISEKNQILIALFAIVVLCAGKLLKDYMFRRGYIEGLTVIPETNKILKRPPSNSNNLTGVVITLNLKLGSALQSDGTITVNWPTGTGVTMSTTVDDYAVDVSGVVVPAGKKNLSSNANPTTLTITNGSTAVASGTKVTITMSNVTVDKGDSAITNFGFTTTAGTESVYTPIIINVPSSSNGVTESTSVQEIRDALDNINKKLASSNANDPELLKIKNALINVLAYTYGTIKEAGNVFNSEELYNAQQTAMQFIEKEKARSKKKADDLKDDNNNKRRMAQINTYYTRNYEANTDVMKIIIYVSVALIVLAVLRNKEMIPASIGTLGVILVLTFGGIAVGSQVFDIIRRNDHDFDKYDWNFDENEMDRKNMVQKKSGTVNLSDIGMGMAGCYGPGCCNIGTRWDEATNKCVPVGSAVFTATANSSKLTIYLQINTNLTVSNPSVSTDDKITLKLPPGFSVPVGTTIAGGSGTVKTDSFDVTPTTSITTAPTIHTITITGLTYTSSPPQTDKTLKVKTTKEPSEGSIFINGI